MTIPVNGNSGSNTTTTTTVTFPTPTWGIDTNLTDAEASAQAAFYLGAIADEMDTYAKSGNTDTAALAEIKRLGGIIQAYENQTSGTTYTLDPQVKGWIDSLFGSGAFDASGNLTDATKYLTLYRLSDGVDANGNPVLSKDSIVSQILTWMSATPAPYTFDQNTNADTTFAATMFMGSFYGDQFPDLDGNMENFYASQAGGIGQYDQMGEFMGLYLANNEAQDAGFTAEIQTTLSDKDPSSSLPAYDKFLAQMKAYDFDTSPEYLYLLGQGETKAQALAQALAGSASFGYQGFANSNSSTASTTASAAATSSSASTASGSTTLPNSNAVVASATTPAVHPLVALEKLATPAAATTVAPQSSASDSIADRLNTYFKTAGNSLNTAPVSTLATTSKPSSLRIMSGSVAAGSNTPSIVPQTTPPKGATSTFQSNGDGPLPPPPGGLPPTGAPDGSLPAVDAGYQFGQGPDPYLNKFMQFIEYFGRVKTTDTGALFNFMNYITALSGAPGDPLNNDAALKAMMNQSGALNMVQSALQQAVYYSFFTSSDPKNAGANMIAYIEQLKGVVQNLPDGDFKSAMTTSLDGLEVQAPDFATEHTDPTTGDLIWTDNDTGMTYDWTNPKDPDQSGSPYGGDQFMIETIIGSLGASSSQQLVNNCKQILQSYRVDSFNELMSQFKDPMFVIMLWIMMYFDQDAQSQESGENDQAKVMSNVVTGYYANGFQTLAGKAGNWSGSGASNDVAQFRWLLDSSDTYMDDAAETQSIASNWKQTGTGPIGQIMVPGYTVNGQPGDLKQYLNDSSIDDSTKAGVLNTLFAPNPPGSGLPPAYQANTNYQALTQATTGMVQIGNGQSKNITTQLGTLATLESAIDKTMDQIVNATSGLMSMQTKFVQNQHSN